METKRKQWKLIETSVQIFDCNHQREPSDITSVHYESLNDPNRCATMHFRTGSGRRGAIDVHPADDETFLPHLFIHSNGAGILWTRCVNEGATN